MLEVYKSVVAKAERAAEGGDPYAALRELPISVFGKLLVQPNIECPGLKELLPRMPPADIQIQYNGRANFDLLPSSVSFIESVNNAFVAITGKRFPEGGNVLDYGFGWGRLLRMACWFTSPNRIYGVDVLPKSIELCRQYGVDATLCLCDELPTALPTPIREESFDLAFSFSVFTHLSFRAANAVLGTLHRYVKRNGLLVITIRPVEFWDYYKTTGKISAQQYTSLRSAHQSDGYAYIPQQGWAPIEGETHFGDTSMTLDFIESNWPQWHVAGTNLTLEDPFQLHVFLVRKV